MDAQKVDMFITVNAKYFKSHHVPQIRERLLALDESKWVGVLATPMKEPTISLIVSLMSGHFGIDRFMIGDTGLGVGKLLTCGGFGIWTIIDWFMIVDATREKNIQKLQQAIM